MIKSIKTARMEQIGVKQDKRRCLTGVRSPTALKMLIMVGEQPPEEELAFDLYFLCPFDTSTVPDRRARSFEEDIVFTRSVERMRDKIAKMHISYGVMIQILN